MDTSSDDNADHEFIAAHCRVLKITDTKGNTKEMYLPKSLDLERPKRSRTNFTIGQLKELEKAFARNQYLVGKERKSLSERLCLSEAQIKIWYQNRRTKHKKEKYKERERMAANAESIATNNIMSLLERQHFSQQSPPIMATPRVNDCRVDCRPKQFCSPIQCQNQTSSAVAINPLAFGVTDCDCNSTSTYLTRVYLSHNLLNK